MKLTILRKPPRFVLLDDDPLALTMTEKLIRNHCRRSEIIKFLAAREAMEFMQDKKFMSKATETVFMMDLHMPEIDGFGVLEGMSDTLKALGDRLHVFVVSAAACPNEIRRVLSYSCVIGFLKKPFSDNEMKRIMCCIQYPL